MRFFMNLGVVSSRGCDSRLRLSEESVSMLSSFHVGLAVSAIGYSIIVQYNII